MMEKITVAELHGRLKAQGVSNRNHVAFVCVMCGTVQSMASLVRAGATQDRAERMIGFSCEGRLTNAGPWAPETERSEKAKARRLVRGCDWTLGGLFTLHKLAVVTEDGEEHPRFQLASPEQAQALEREMTPTTTDV